MFKTPLFLGHIRTDRGEPTLIFDSGFLVQASLKPDQNGWYAFGHTHQVGANVNPEIAAELPGLEVLETSWPAVFRQVRDARDRDNEARTRGQPAPAGATRHVLFDTPSLDLVSQASIYCFAGPLVRPGDPDHDARFNAAYAGTALGDVLGTGLPTRHAAVATRRGIVAIA